MIDTSPLDRHERIALSFSGGKDSFVVWDLLREHLHRLTVYHVDTGDLLPEQREVVDYVRERTPNFVTIDTDVMAWTRENGLPTDLLPYSSHLLGEAMGQSRVKLVQRYDCCAANLMVPNYLRQRQDGVTLVIRGTKKVDLARLPTQTGDVFEGMEFWNPIEDWTHEQVFEHLRSRGLPVSRVYDYVTNSPECARCTAWWGEQRNAYLKRFHPCLWTEYKERLLPVIQEIDRAIAPLNAEMADVVDAPAMPDDYFTGGFSDVGLRVLQGHRLHENERQHVRILSAYMILNDGATVLDVGCGTGAMAEMIADDRPDLKWVLVNKHPDQLARVPDRLNPRLGDFHSLPVDTTSVDETLFCYSLCHADHFEALREAARVTRPGGGLFIYDYERLGGDNALMEAVLFARAYSHKDIVALARAAGWQLDHKINPAGDSSVFRSLFPDPDQYDAIFKDLRPAIWRFVRVS